MREPAEGTWFDRVCGSAPFADRINHPEPSITECWTDEELDDDDA